MIAKRVDTFPFMCGLVNCPKHLDVLNSYTFKNLNPPIDSKTPRKGCAQFRTSVWYLADSPLSADEIQALPTIGVLMPNPDPTGAQGIGGSYGVGKDIIFEQLFKANKGKPTKVALFYLVRGYSIKNKAFRNELSASALQKAAVSYCMSYLEQDLLKVKPEKLLLCGQEPINVFFPNGEIATLRRTYGLSIKVGDIEIPTQITFNPYLAAIAPVYIKSLSEDCVKLFEPPVESPPTACKLITDFDEAIEYLDFLEQFQGRISFDVETENLHRKANNRLATLQFATNNTRGVVIPYQHWETPFSVQELSILGKKFNKLFKNKIQSSGWIAHNAKFENMMSQMHFATMLKSADIYDTQAMAFLLDETRSERKADVPKDGGIYTLKQLAWDLLNFQGYDKGILKIRGEGSLFDLPLVDLAEYGAMDAVVTRRLHDRIIELAHQDDNYDQTLLKFTRLFYGPITRLIAHIEQTGFKVDLRTLRQLSGKHGPFETRMQEIVEQLKATEAFHEANKKLVQDRGGGSTVGVMGTVPWVLDFNKPDHQALVFYKTMELEPVSFSEKTGRPAIDDDFFTAYCSDPAKGIEGSLEVDLFYKYQETKKMRDTFIKKILMRVDPQTGDADCKLDQRIRPNIHYSRLVTGRFAMTEPNMGQIPKAEEGLTDGDFGVRKSVKDLFTVERGGALLQVDYKVNEVRWAAILAQDSAMARIFNEAAKRIMAACLSEDKDKIKEAEFFEDIHRNTASEAFGVAITAVTKTQRNASKAITFGILFQQSAKALAEAIGVSEEEAIKFQEKFFSKMTGIKNLIDDLKHQASTKGYVESPHGRRRRFWSFHLPNNYPYKRSQEARNLRQAVNSPIQGIASDAAMYGGAVSLLDYIEDNGKDWVIQNVVHDSCLIQLKDARETAEAMLVMHSIFVEQAMEKMTELGVNFNLPLGIDVEAGTKWGSLERWNGTKTQAMELQESIVKMWELN